MKDNMKVLVVMMTLVVIISLRGGPIDYGALHCRYYEYQAHISRFLMLTEREELENITDIDEFAKLLIEIKDIISKIQEDCDFCTDDLRCAFSDQCSKLQECRQELLHSQFHLILRQYPPPIDQNFEDFRREDLEEGEEGYLLLNSCEESE